LNILIFNWRDIKNPAAGGAEVFTHEIAERLVAQGHNVSIFTAGFKNSRSSEVINGVKIFRDGNRYTVYLKAKGFYKKHSGKFDVVVDEINTRPFMAPKFVKDGTPVVALIHQLAREFWFLETKFPINWLGYHVLEDMWLKNYVDIPTLTVSNSTKQDLVDLGFKDIIGTKVDQNCVDVGTGLCDIAGCVSVDISIIPEGLNITPLDLMPEKEEDPTFVFVGRMGHAKRPDHVVKAFSIIKEHRPDAKLWMVGDGAMKKQLEAMNPDGVTYFGFVNQEKKHELMSRAHAILVPGIREGWGACCHRSECHGYACNRL